MARLHIHEDVSRYYPPRARWYSGIVYLLRTIYRRLELGRFVLPPEVKVSRLFLGLLVPGLGIYFRRPREGRMAMAAAAALMLVFIIGLGFRIGNIAFGLLISLHVTGFIYYCEPLLAREPFPQRIGFSILVLLFMGLLIYLPVRNYVQRHLFLPLLLPDRVIVIHPTTDFKAVRRGDWVAYQLAENSAGDRANDLEIMVAGGMDFGPVLAVAGDEVTFSNGVFTVNGVWHPDQPHMPGAGGFTVSENQWFIWPEFGKSGHGNISEAILSGILMNAAQVNMNQYRGKPYQSWFGRKQVLP
jgi:hypothetical protein